MSDAYSERRPDGSEPDPTTRSPYSRHGTPAPLAVAAGLTFVEGVLTLIFGLGEAVSIQTMRYSFFPQPGLVLENRVVVSPIRPGRWTSRRGSVGALMPRSVARSSASETRP